MVKNLNAQHISRGHIIIRCYFINKIEKIRIFYKIKRNVAVYNRIKQFFINFGMFVLWNWFIKPINQAFLSFCFGNRWTTGQNRSISGTAKIYVSLAKIKILLGSLYSYTQTVLDQN